jgi:YfiH family protein
MWLEPQWPAPKNVTAITTLRGTDSDAEFAAHFQGMSCATIKQVHGTVAVDAANNITGTEADACFGRSPGIACRVLTADCLPLLLCNRAGSEVAAIHAGWRGLAAGVIENTLAQLESHPSDLLVWLGPAISKQHFEVGPEVRDAFLQASPVESAFESSGQKYLADLYAIARARLKAVGCKRVYGGDFCTYADSQRFYSWRRDQTSGRMHSFIAFS